MLAQSFMMAEELQITEAQKDALVKTLAFFETGKIQLTPVGNRFFPDSSKDFTGHFNMCQWNAQVHGCGTVACIGGTAELIGGVKFSKLSQLPPGLYTLFMPNLPDSAWPHITPAQAATALRSYLTTGSANWQEAVR